MIEIFFLVVNMDLGGLGFYIFGVLFDDFVDLIFEELKKDKIEIGYGDSVKRFYVFKEEIEKVIV